MLNPQLAWYVAGPSLGLCVIAVRLLLNARLGVTGGYSEIVGRLHAGKLSFDWRGWFVLGVLLGGAVFALAAGGPDFHGYGWLTESFDHALVGPVLLGAGVLVGYGASLAATATFFATAIAVSFLTRAVF